MIARYWPVLVVLYAGLSYGFVFSINRFVTEAGVPFLGYVFWQAAGATAILLGVCALRRRLPRLDLAHVKLYLVIGLFGVTYPSSIWTLVAPKIPIGIVVLGLGLVPSMVYLISLGLRMERFVGLRALGILLGLGGMLLIVVPETSLPSPDLTGWVLLTFTAPLSFALMTIAGDRLRPEGSDLLGDSLGLVFVAAISLVPLMAIFDGWWVFAAPLDRIDGAVLLAILIVATNWIAFFAVIKARGPVFWTMSNYLDTLCGIGWGILLYHERHSPWVWAAAGLILGSLVLINRTAPAARKAEAA